MELLGYIEKWKNCVNKREGFNATQKKMMTLSEETIEGLQITGYQCFKHMYILFVMHMQLAHF